MQRVVFIAKTDLNTDGRILNELNILKNANLNVKIDFILFPDKPLKILLDKDVTVHQIKTFIRNSKYLRIFTALEFMIRSLILLLRLKPEILHAQDTAIIQPVLIYRCWKGSTFKLIYDDHEIPNENASFFNRIFNSLEVLLMKKSDNIIFANNERMETVKNRHNLKTSCTYFLNLPYFTDDSASINKQIDIQLDNLDKEIESGTKFIIHQGPIGKERGREKLADFSKILPDNFKILLLGGNKNNFLDFLEEYKLDINKFHFRGSVNYLTLPQYWEKGVASIVMYLPTFINNRLCAPNRFYISLQKGLPVFINRDNPVLSNFINKYQCGFYIEEMNVNNIVTSIENLKVKKIDFEKLREEQIENFISVYRKNSPYLT